MHLFKRKEWWLSCDGRKPHYLIAPDRPAAEKKAGALALRLGLQTWTLGHDPACPWTGRFESQGRDIWRDLGPDKKAAEQRLRALIRASADARFAAIDSTRQRQQPLASLGDIFARYTKNARVAEHVRVANIRAMGTLVRRARGVTLAQLPKEALALEPGSLLTERLVLDMQTQVVALAGASPLAQDSARITANAIRRMARSLFASAAMPFYNDLQLPDLTPFLRVRPLKEPDRSYRMPPADLLARTRAAAPALKQSDPNLYRIWLLALGSGLRRNEILHASWDWLVPVAGGHQLHVQTTAHFRPKGKRDRLVPLEPLALAQLTELRIPRLDGQPEPLLEGKLWQRRAAFYRFGRWMKSLGWTRPKKAHELRKIFGSVVNERAGLVAAQHALGHAHVTTTAASYVAPLTLPSLNILAS